MRRKATDLFPNSEQSVDDFFDCEEYRKITTDSPSTAVPSPSIAMWPLPSTHTLPKNSDESPNIDSEFGLDLRVNPTKESDWVHNKETGKVYIKPRSIITTTFSFKHGKRNEKKLFLRAMVVNTTPEYMHEAVKRCGNHRMTFVDPERLVPPEHILKCHSSHVQYLGDEYSESSGERLSVVVPLGRLATHSRVSRVNVSVRWSFICTNSCAAGVKRKSTAVIFTLENNEEILGKKVMPFLVCTKPKRGERGDNIKPADRGESGSRKRSADTAASLIEPPGRKVFLAEGSVKPATSTLASSQNTNEPCVLKFSMPDTDSANHVLVCARNAVAEVQLRGQYNPSHANCMNEIERCITSLKQSPTNNN